MAVALRTAAGATVTGIEETALRALAKLEGVLPPPLRGRVTAVSSAMVPLPSFGALVDPGLLASIASAIRDRERLRLPAANRRRLARGPSDLHRRDRRRLRGPRPTRAGRGDPPSRRALHARG